MKREKLTMYAEGLLESSEREAIESQLDGDPDLRVELEAIRETLAALEEDAAELEGDEPDWEQMSGAIEAALDAPVVVPPRRRFVSHVAIALVSAAAAAALTFFAMRDTPRDAPTAELGADSTPLAIDDWPELEALANASPEQIEVVLASLEALR